MRRARLHTPAVSGRIPWREKKPGGQTQAPEGCGRLPFLGRGGRREETGAGEGKREERDVNGKERREWIIRWLYLG